MRKLIYLFSIVALLFISCSGDDEGSGDSGLILVKKAVNVNEDGEQGITFNYSYNGTKINTIETSIGQKTQYFYNGNLITKVHKYISNNGSLHIEVNLQYDANERLIKEEYTDFFISNMATQLYTYEADGSVSFLSYSGEIGGITELKGTGKYFFNANNEIVKIETVNVNTNVVRTADFTYDTQNNIFKNVVGWNKLFPLTGKVNNVLTSSSTYSDIGFMEEYSNEYEYNNAGYPTSVTTTIGTSSSKVYYYY